MWIYRLSATWCRSTPRAHLYQMAKPQNCPTVCEGSNMCGWTQLKHSGPRIGAWRLGSACLHVSASLRVRSWAEIERVWAWCQKGAQLTALLVWIVVKLTLELISISKLHTYGLHLNVIATPACGLMVMDNACLFLIHLKNPSLNNSSFPGGSCYSGIAFFWVYLNFPKPTPHRCLGAWWGDGKRGL